MVMVRNPLSYTSSPGPAEEEGTSPSNRGNSIVMSVFAIVILSVIGALFKSNHHSMTGSTADPQDGAAVAATVFSAVAVYAVSHSTFIIALSFLTPSCSAYAYILTRLSSSCFWLAAVSRLICISAIIEKEP